MITDQQMRIVMDEKQKGRRLYAAAAKAGVCEGTARKYLKVGVLPSETRIEHRWRTREDPFEGVWEDVCELLEGNSGLSPKTIFEYLCREHPGSFSEGQLRTLQRRVKVWRALAGPGREVYFPQVHEPGETGASDFTRMGSLGVTIGGAYFDHMLYHFTLVYSGWEDVTICFSESFEALSEGFQNALWRLGGVPQEHLTDNLSAAVNNLSEKGEFTRRYGSLLGYYRLKGRRINPGRANENGSIESRNGHFKRTLKQALMLRGSCDFASREEYELFLRELLTQLNGSRGARLSEEKVLLRSLPPRRLESYRTQGVKVSRNATIRVLHNTYSVHSRLMGEQVEVRAYADHLEVWYAQRKVETLPRLRGEGKSRIFFRHIIDSLVRKPGAFANYKYRSDLFPSTNFRLVYDWLKENRPSIAEREYLQILLLAARESEALTEAVLRGLLDREEAISAEAVKSLLQSLVVTAAPPEVLIEEIDLSVYDALLTRAVS